LDYYKSEIVGILLNRLHPLGLTPGAKKRMARIVPELLIGFALRLGQYSTTKAENQVMYFVLKYRM
jgi:hypothetical protein